MLLLRAQHRDLVRHESITLKQLAVLARWPHITKENDLKEIDLKRNDIKKRFFTNSRIFLENRSKLRNQAFGKMFRRHLGFTSFSKILAENQHFYSFFCLLNEKKCYI